MITQKMDISSPAQSDPMASKITRSGRVSKPPVRYEPVEQVEDDYAPEDYDSNEVSDVSSDIETESDEEDSESDADEYGNLEGFIVPDKNESDGDYTDGESSVSSANRSTTGATTPTAPRGRVVTPATNRRSARRRIP